MCMPAKRFLCLLVCVCALLRCICQPRGGLDQQLAMGISRVVKFNVVESNMGVCMWINVPWHMCEWLPLGVTCLLPPSGSQTMHSGHQAWWQAFSLTPRLLFFFFFKVFLWGLGSRNLLCKSDCPWTQRSACINLELKPCTWLISSSLLLTKTRGPRKPLPAQEEKEFKATRNSNSNKVAPQTSLD